MFHARSLVFATALGTTTLAIGEWPTDPTDALVVGSIELGFSERIALVEADDGSVWFAWQESFCGGVVRVQRISATGDRLAPDAIAVQDDPTCGFALPPLLVTSEDDVIVTRALAPGESFPVQRVGSEGEFAWGTGFAVANDPVVESLLVMPDGDTLVASRSGGAILLDRVAPDGSAVWEAQSIVPSGSGSNFRILGAITDDAGGAFLFWDAPLAYTRLIHAMRVDGDGAPLWPARASLVEPPPGIASSRHSTPAVLADGEGGAVVVFVRGFESGTTPAPLLLQRVGPDGALAHPIAGVRVAEGTRRQFDPLLSRDAATNDLLVTWRDGQFAETTVRAQLLRADGVRRWAPGGVAIAALDATLGSFDGRWLADGPRVAIAGATTAELHALDPIDGAAAGATLVRTDGSPRSVRVVGAGDGVVVAWQEDLGGNEDGLLAQRVRADGTLGGAGCGPADLDRDGTVGGADLSLILSGWGTCIECGADLDGDGSVTASDLAIVLGAWGSCGERATRP